ncbi:MAG: FkbM family methyltransferase [Bacteroidota bacterium]
MTLPFFRNKKEFNQICKANDLQLDYSTNRPTLPILKEIFEQRSYSAYFPFYQKATVVDIGAHFGYFSLFAHKNLHPDAKIIAIEASKENVERLKQNIEKNMAQNVEVVSCGIGKESGEAQLYKGASVNHSILPEYNLAKEQGETIEIQTLAQIMETYQLEHIDFLKLDCEGAEYQILETLPNEIFQKIGVISMEFHDLKDAQYHGDFLRHLLIQNHFSVVKYEYSATSMGNNYGKLIGKKK